MQVPFIDFQSHYKKIKSEIEKEVIEVLASGRYVAGPKIKNFERNFAAYCGVKYALGVNNGTSALIVALLALGVKKGDEVITQPNTFVATAEAIIFTGAKPVFADIDSRTYNVDIGKLKKAVTKKTKVILPVHLFGQSADMAPIMRLAKKHNLYVVEDAAQAHGAEYQGKKAGAIGDIGCFSFYPTKVLGACGEGGAVTTNSPELAQKMAALRDHGSERKYYHDTVGFNFRLEEIQGAVLGAKLKHLNKWIGARRMAAKNYNKLFRGSSVITPFEPDFSGSVYYVYVVRVKNREKLQEYLENRGIGTMVHYPLPIHLQEGYRFLGYKEGDFPEAERAAREILSLPFYPELKLEEQKYVVKKIKEFFGEK